MAEEPHPLHLRVVSPEGVAVDCAVDQVSAEATSGWFTLLPRHLDLVAPLAAGLVAYRRGDAESLLAVEGGTLVKCGDRIEVASPAVFPGDSVLELQRALRKSFQQRSERERTSRAALARLEHDVVGGLMNVEDDGPP